MSGKYMIKIRLYGMWILEQEFYKTKEEAEKRKLELDSKNIDSKIVEVNMKRGYVNVKWVHIL